MPTPAFDSDLAGTYDKNFYKSQGASPIQSARMYLAYLWKYFQPDSVLDVGCGRGAWLKACHELGSESLFGFDGDWNNQSLMIDSAIKFQSKDLNQPFSVPQRVDLAMTLEVAEHLEPSGASQFVKCLTLASDAVLFSAAYTGQGGDNHINEQPHTYWANLFAVNEFVAFDLFRPVFWANKDISFWYRQNTFLYLKWNSASYQKFRTHGFRELVDVGFMDCVHPDLYAKNIGSAPSVRSHVTDLVPSVVRAIKRRIS